MLSWQKAIDRRTGDPDGAITAARTTLESICKLILDDAGIEHDGKDDLPALDGRSLLSFNSLQAITRSKPSSRPPEERSRSSTASQPFVTASVTPTGREPSQFVRHHVMQALL